MSRTFKSEKHKSNFEEYLDAEAKRFKRLFRDKVLNEESVFAGFIFVEKEGTCTVPSLLIKHLDDGELQEKSFLMMMGVEKGREYNKVVRRVRSIKPKKANEKER